MYHRRVMLNQWFFTGRKAISNAGIRRERIEDYGLVVDLEIKKQCLVQALQYRQSIGLCKHRHLT